MIVSSWSALPIALKLATYSSDSSQPMPTFTMEARVTFGSKPKSRRPTSIHSSWFFSMYS